MCCRLCGKSVGMVRRLAGIEFCSRQHEQEFDELQRQIFTARLLEEHSRLERLLVSAETPRAASGTAAGAGAAEDFRGGFLKGQTEPGL